MTYARPFQYKPPLPGVVAAAIDWKTFDDDDSAAVSAPPMRVHGIDPHVALTLAQHAHSAALWSFGTPRIAAGVAGPWHVALDGLHPLLHATRNPAFNIAAVIEAIRLLDLVQMSVAGLPSPEIGVSKMEASIGWTKGDQIVLISLEGDGEPAYTYQVNGKFTPGKEQFLLRDGRIPDDLRDYLKAMYA